MKKELMTDLTVLVLNIVILVLITSTNFLFQGISVASYYVTYGSIIAGLLLIVLQIIKNNSKVSLALNVTRLDFERLVTVLVFNFYYISFIIAFLANYQIQFFIGLFMVTCELFIIIFSILISFKNINFTIDKLFLKIRDIIFFLMALVLIFNNVPFSTYSIPLDQVLIATYTCILSYFVYTLYKYLRIEL